MDNIGNQITDVNGQVVAQQQQVQAQAVNTVPVQQPVVTNQQVQNSQALFTQEQLNSIISGRINPLNQKIQELNAQLAQEQQLSQSYLNELTGFKNRESAVKAGVPAQFVDFAVFEASKLAVNGKSFDDAMKEYVSSNGQLFGVSQSGGQVQPTPSPVVGQTTQGVANPAQAIQGQQTVSGSTVVSPSVQVASNTVPTAGVEADVVNANTVQYGATNIQTAGNPANINSIDSQVDAFLKSHNLIK